MSDKTYEMIGGDGEQYGPFTIQQLQDNLSDGRATPQTQIRETGTEACSHLVNFLILARRGKSASHWAQLFQVINRWMLVWLSAAGGRYSNSTWEL